MHTVVALERRYVKIARAAALLDVHPNTVRRYIQNHQLPAIVLPTATKSKFGQRYRVALQDLRGFKAAREADE